jgi:exosortase J
VIRPVMSDKGFAVPVAENPEFSSAPAAMSASNLKSVSRPRNRLLLGLGIAVLAAAGCFGLYRELAILWSVWTLDPLRSIGMLIPPVSIWLTLRVWRQYGWQMRGTWWGLGLIGLAYLLNLLQQKVLLLAVFGSASLSFLPISLPLSLYGSGIVLLFAGAEVWCQAWFPLGLLLLAQPVPLLTNGLIDIPLQEISARVARSFASLIHFAPSTPQLRLMFSPSFGMFIAPGCDGIRGAVAMGYVALIAGYLKRFHWYLWSACVAGAVLLGYLFNFIRLCVLVVYYRIALGHPALENAAAQADYVIGSCLFLVATTLFIWVVSRKQRNMAPEICAPAGATGSFSARTGWIKCVAFAATSAAALALPSSALNAVRSTNATLESLAARFPTQIGEFSLTRKWSEQSGGTTVVQAGAYSAPGSDEITLGVWVAPLVHFHDANACWLARGLEPELLTTRAFLVGQGKSVKFNTGFYSDGITDSIVVNAVCTPETCSPYQSFNSAKRFGFVRVDLLSNSFESLKQNPVSIMVRIDRIHTNESKAATHDLLAAEAQRFLAGLNPTRLSSAFQ